MVADEGDDLRAGRRVKVKLEGAAADRVELLHRLTATPGIERVAFLAGGKAAHNQRAELKCGQRNEIRSAPEIEAKDWRNDEIVEARNRQQRSQRCLL